MIPRRSALLLAVAVLWGCAHAPVAAPPPKDPALASLPEGEGRDLLATVCTTCHNLDGLDAYRGYWDVDQWRDMVQTMVDHGAELDERQVSVLADFLGDNLGPGAR